jgi:hypothetical protein
MQEKNRTPAVGTYRNIYLSGNCLAATRQSLVTAVNSYPRARYAGLFCWILFWKLSRIIEDGLTKKINPNTNIFNLVITAVQKLKELFTSRHNVAPTARSKTGKKNILLRAVQLPLRSNLGNSSPFFFERWYFNETT